MSKKQFYLLRGKLYGVNGNKLFVYGDRLI